MLWLKVILFGLILGSFYTILAVGFALIFGVTRTFNLAHGELIVVAGYLAYFLHKSFGLNLVFTLPAAVALSAALGVVLSRVFRAAGEPREINTIVLSFGLAILLQNGMLMLFSGDYRLIRAPFFFHRIDLGAVGVSYGQLFVLILSVAAIFALFYLKRRTYLGKALRATIQDSQAAALAGVDVGLMHLIAFVIGFVLIGLAGPLYATLHYLYPTAGIEATMISITITIFAGVGRMRPIIFGSWLLGTVESAAMVVLGASWREMVTAVVLIGLLVAYPKGIRGRR